WPDLSRTELVGASARGARDAAFPDEPTGAHRRPFSGFRGNWACFDAQLEVSMETSNRCREGVPPRGRTRSAPRHSARSPLVRTPSSAPGALKKLADPWREAVR